MVSIVLQPASEKKFQKSHDRETIRISIIPKGLHFLQRSSPPIILCHDLGQFIQWTVLVNINLLDCCPANRTTFRFSLHLKDTGIAELCVLAG